MDRRLIIVIGIVLLSLVGFLIFKKMFKKENSVHVNYVIENVINKTFYTDSTIHFSDKTENATSWNWDFGDEQFSTDKNPTHIYTEPGNYKIKLTATGNFGSKTDSLIVLKINLKKDTIALVKAPTPKVIDKPVVVAAAPKVVPIVNKPKAIAPPPVKHNNPPAIIKQKPNPVPQSNNNQKTSHQEKSNDKLHEMDYEPFEKK